MRSLCLCSLVVASFLVTGCARHHDRPGTSIASSPSPGPADVQTNVLGPGVPVKVTLPPQGDEGTAVAVIIELDYSNVSSAGPTVVMLQYSDSADWLNPPVQILMNGPRGADNKVTTSVSVASVNRSGTVDRAITVSAVVLGIPPTVSEATMTLRGRP